MSWPLVKIGDVSIFVRGVTFTPDDQVEPFSPDSSVVMRTKNVQVAGLDESDLIAIPSVLVKRDEQILQSGDVLISSANSWELVGKASYVSGLNYLATAGGFISIVRARKNSIDSRYLYHWISSPESQHKIRHCGRQTTNISNLDVERFKELEIPLPPLEEQKRIAAILDKADAIRRKRQQAIKLADDFLRSVFLEMFGDPVTNPKGWEVKTLGEFCSFQGGFAFKSVDYTDYGVPLLKITNVHFEDVDWDDVSYLPEKMLLEKSDFSLEVGDLVMAMTRPIIKSLEAVKVVEIKNNDIPSLLNQRVGRFKGYDRVAAKEFFKYFLYSEYFRSEVEKLCSVALQPNVSSKQIESILCYLPPRNVQDEFSRIVSCVNKMLPKLKVASQENLFEALSQKAFSGQL